MNIAVLFTGGTIGSTLVGNVIGTKTGAADGLLDTLSCVERDGHVEEITYQVYHPYTLLSENSTGLTIAQLAQSIREVVSEAKYTGSAKVALGNKGEAEDGTSVFTGLDGVIIMHGTDTLAYSAAAMGYLFGDCDIPMVFVSSNYVLTDPRANGAYNFQYAVQFLAFDCKQKGVYVSYQNGDGIPRIHLGTAIIGHQPYSDEVYSVGGMEYGHYEKGTKCFVAGKMYYAWNNTERLTDRPSLQAPDHWDAPIGLIYPHPGMRYPMNFDGIQAILHHTYHAGTICSETPEADKFFYEVANRKIPIFLCGMDADMVYESTYVYEKYGMIVLPMASPVAMYMKLWLLLCSGYSAKEWMTKPIPGDLPNFSI